MKKIFIILPILAVLFLASCSHVTKNTIEETSNTVKEMNNTSQPSNESMPTDISWVPPTDTSTQVVQTWLWLVTGAYANYTQSGIKNDATNVLFFHAWWCPSCNSADKKLSSEIIPDGLNILKTDFDSNLDLRKKYGVVAQHTFVQVDSEGTLITKWVGGRSVEDILDNLK